MTTTNRLQTARYAAQMAAFAQRIGERMRERREELKGDDPRWTQEYAARQLPGNVSGAQYARWERGEVMPREDTLKHIAKTLGLTIEDLYASQHQPTESTGPELAFKAADVERSIRIEAKLDALLSAAGIDYLDATAPRGRQLTDDPLTDAPQAADPLVEDEPGHTSQRPASGSS